MTRSATRELAPEPFRRALKELADVRTRPEIEFAALPAPARLAPWSHAVSASVVDGGDRPEAASGRLVILYDPDGLTAWEGTLRIVIFLTAEIDEDIARDVLLPDVAWSWLVESLTARGAVYRALGGTVTATSSTRFGDIAGPVRSDDLEIRASWTAVDDHVGRSVRGFADLLAVAAGLPPEGVAAIGRPSPSNVR